MLLLTPSEAQKRTRSDDVLKAVRSKELSDAVNDKQIELAKLEEAGAKFLASQRARWALEEADHAARAKEMRSEIDSMTIERERLLVPIEEIRLKAENKLQEADKTLLVVQKKEQENDILALQFEKRFDELDEHETQLKDLAKRLTRRESGIKAQDKHTTQRAQEIAVAAERFLRSAEEREEAIAKRANELQVAQINIDTISIAQMRKESELAMKEANLIARYKMLEKAEEYVKEHE